MAAIVVLTRTPGIAPSSPPRPPATAPSVTTTIPVGEGPLGVAITPDGHHAYVINTRSNTVSVIDTSSG